MGQQRNWQLVSVSYLSRRWGSKAAKPEGFAQRRACSLYIPKQIQHSEMQNVANLHAQDLRLLPDAAASYRVSCQYIATLKKSEALICYSSQARNWTPRRGSEFDYAVAYCGAE